MVVRKLIERLSKVHNLDTEIFVSINGNDGIEIKDITDEIDGVFLESTVTTLELLTWE